MTKRCLVAGGASGIGAAIADRLCADGWTVFVLDRQAMDTPTSKTVDLRNSEAVHEAVTAFGAERSFDAVVVTAGVGVFGAIADTTDGAWRAAIDHNLTGPFHLLRAVIPFLADSSSVVTVASTNAIAPLRFEGAYTAAKAGLVAMSQSLALELAPRTRVNVVSHGLIDTPFIERITSDSELSRVAAEATPMGRIGTPDDAVGLIQFLLGSQAGYITGQHFVIDGGGTLPRTQSDAIMRQLSARGVA
ncbi:MAG: SDR family oxidoreductase [Acidimicrobiia bacterium]